MSDLTLFLHIPKTAGTSLRSVFEKNYSLERSLYIGRTLVESKDRLINMSDSERLQLQLIAGHMHYGWHELVPERTPQYITLLRNPVERIISFYHFVRGSEWHWLYKMINIHEISLEDFVSGLLPHELDNGQTRILAGEDVEEEKKQLGGVGEELLERAKKNLLRSNMTFGLTEYFDDSLLLFQRKLGWERIEYETRLVGNYRCRDVCTQEVREKIEKRNNIDVKLYEWARTHFQAQALEQLTSVAND